MCLNALFRYIEILSEEYSRRLKMKYYEHETRGKAMLNGHYFRHKARISHTVFKLRGDSFRGKKLETVSLQTSKVQDVEPLAAPEV